MKPAARVITLLLSAIAVLHLLRLVFWIEIEVNSAVVPMWTSGVAALVLMALVTWFWREQQQ